MILVVSSAKDSHARRVMDELEVLGAEARLLDLSEFPQSLGLMAAYSGSGASRFELRWADGTRLNADAIDAVWWRRPQPFQVSSGIIRPVHMTFAYNECHEAFAGFWQSLDVDWVNHPTRDYVAAHKAYQLKVAQEVGLTVPRTLISNDPAEVQAFVEDQGHGRTIYKAFTATEQEWRETRLLREDELPLLTNVRHAPVIFQEYIEPGADLRITAVGDDLFAAAIYPQETAYAVDFRIDMHAARTEAHELPPDFADRLRTLMRRLGLVYGAIDVRLGKDGRYVFLEINPAGQWLFVEQRTGQPITATLARRLARTSPVGA